MIETYTGKGHFYKVANQANIQANKGTGVNYHMAESVFTPIDNHKPNYMSIINL